MNPFSSTFTPSGPAVILNRPAVIEPAYDTDFFFSFNPETNCYHLTRGPRPVHRDDGPALVTYDGLEMWVQNGTLHREDGPAWLDRWGYDRWLRHGQLHREDGAAQVGPTGYRKHWLLGTRLNRSNYDLLIDLEPDLRALALEHLKDRSLSPLEIGQYLEAFGAASTQLH